MFSCVSVFHMYCTNKVFPRCMSLDASYLSEDHATLLTSIRILTSMYSHVAIPMVKLFEFLSTLVTHVRLLIRVRSHGLVVWNPVRILNMYKVWYRYVFSCICRSSVRLNVLPHTSHWHGLSICMCSHQHAQVTLLIRVDRVEGDRENGDRGGRVERGG